MEDEHEEAERDDNTGIWIYIGSRKVQDGGRVNIPAESYDIGEGEYVHLDVEHGDDAFFVPDRPVDGKGRVSIPKEQRKLYEIDEGDIVKVNFQAIGRSADGDAGE